MNNNNNLKNRIKMYPEEEIIRVANIYKAIYKEDSASLLPSDLPDMLRVEIALREENPNEWRNLAKIMYSLHIQAVREKKEKKK